MSVLLAHHIRYLLNDAHKTVAVPLRFSRRANRINCDVYDDSTALFETTWNLRQRPIATLVEHHGLLMEWPSEPYRSDVEARGRDADTLGHVRTFYICALVDASREFSTSFSLQSTGNTHAL